VLDFLLASLYLTEKLLKIEDAVAELKRNRPRLCVVFKERTKMSGSEDVCYLKCKMETAQRKCGMS